MTTDHQLEGPQLPTATRHDLQLGRRLFHLMNGLIIATLYNLFLTHQQIIAAVGLCASLLYLFEQVRIAYPELSSKLTWINSFLLRAEEQIKESSALPYIMGLLLTIITFPKTVAILAIYTLCIGDPLAAIVGITIGKHKIRPNKTLEGSLAFMTTAFFCTLFVLMHDGILFWASLQVALLTAIFGAILELFPLRIDDNLTIPLYISILAWSFCVFVGVNVN